MQQAGKEKHEREVQISCDQRAFGKPESLVDYDVSGCGETFVQMLMPEDAAQEISLSVRRQDENSLVFRIWRTRKVRVLKI